jgi:pimeloyl-ACP methyl ester carboxylesterase
VSAYGGIIDIVEETHMRLIGEWLANGAVGRISGYAYTSLRKAGDVAGNWLDELLAPARPAGERSSSAEREAVLAAVNGIFGDRLAEAGNPLAIPMRLRRQGRALDLDKDALAREVPDASGKLLVMVHGLCRCDLQWCRNDYDHGEALANELGYTALYLHYNTGRHISLNGREFAQQLHDLVANWPVEVKEIAVIGHSLGGLVARSACHYGKRQGWARKLRHLVFLGTPHHGVPLERGGNWLVEMIGDTALTAPLARVGRLRSAGITDLRYGNLLDEDWHGRHRFAHAADQRRPVPLPRGVKCYAIAGTSGQRVGDIRDRILGDGLIPLDSALGIHAESSRTLPFPTSRQWVALGIHHLELLSEREVYEKLKEWLDPAGGGMSDAG